MHDLKNPPKRNFARVCKHSHTLDLYAGGHISRIQTGWLKWRDLTVFYYLSSAVIQVRGRRKVSVKMRYFRRPKPLIIAIYWSWALSRNRFWAYTFLTPHYYWFSNGITKGSGYIKIFTFSGQIVAGDQSNYSLYTIPHFHPKN